MVLNLLGQIHCSCDRGSRPDSFAVLKPGDSFCFHSRLGLPTIQGSGSANPEMQYFGIYLVFLAVAARAFAAFFLLLLIITRAKNVPTTAEPRRVRMTGMRIAQTRGRNRFCNGWSSSTNGYTHVSDEMRGKYLGLITIRSVHSV